MNNVLEHLQREARACYKRKDYAKALEHFNSAVGRAPSVQLLDNRAACHDKLGDLPAALKDAKKAIQLQKEDPTGYLRAGKILVKMGRQSVAFEIYTHGLKNVKHAGQGYELLRDAHGDLQKQLAPPKSVDPLTVLPRELAEQILEYLTFQQRMNACMVSKQWTIFIRSVPSLWQHLDFSGARRKVKTAFVSRAINVGKKKLTKATLSELYDFDKVLAALIRYCPLDELTLLNTGLQSQNLVDALRKSKRLKALTIGADTRVGGETLKYIMKAVSSTLETFECQGLGSSILDLPEVPFDALTTLIITADSFWFADFSRKIVTFMPNLRTLIAHQRGRYASVVTVPPDFTALDKLECLDLEVTWGGGDLLKLPQSLLILRLDTNGSLDVVLAPTDPPNHLPHLNELSLSVPNLVDVLDAVLGRTDGKESDSVSPSSSLNVLKLSKTFPSGDELDAILSRPRLRRLKHLTLTNRFDSDIESDLLMISKALRELQSIDISGTSITGVELKTLVGMPRIRKITANNCSQLGRDAILWARSVGVVVESKTNHGDSGGRKVRC
ncbi:hypothetical protein LTR56_018127 [Elasticomyces elasticus]|nr:hypothetical protein LTR56_018127 [Elasticomyces elasticus]KAK3642540.1 hypothetical protein LTR22_016075 [Elasticomyces elasticus]KAK4906211.1 hypothetical protein LTR49_024612 [Elasticomyces elasticus]KAK5758029.1 hypothetical protein LTS12_011924 [Elasticomyces elasticus]